MKTINAGGAAGLGKDWHYVTRIKAGRGMWVLHIIIAIGTLAFATYVVNTLLSPPSWWASDGLASDPGRFVADRPVNYPVCAPWTERNRDLARREWQMTEVATPRAVAAGDAVNMGVTLPKNARVMKIYCATGTAECSWLKCDPPLTFLAWDGLYERARVLVLTLTNQSLKKSQRVQVRLWVLWR